MNIIKTIRKKKKKKKKRIGKQNFNRKIGTKIIQKDSLCKKKR